MKQKIAISHPIKVSDVKVSGDGPIFPTINYGIVTHESVPPGTVMIWPQGGADPVVMDIDQLNGKLTTELQNVGVLAPQPKPHTYGIGQMIGSNPYKGSFLAAVDAEMTAIKKQIVGEWKALGPVFSGIKASPPPKPPEVDFIDSSNPFAKVLDAWQTGKAGWRQGALATPTPLTQGSNQ